MSFTTPSTISLVTQPNAALLARLRFIDCIIDHCGTINRSLVMDFFGISTAQASHDLRDYMSHAQGNIEYDSSLRHYRRCPGFQRRFP